MSIGNLPESLSQAMLVGCNVSREIVRRRVVVRQAIPPDKGRGGRGRESENHAPGYTQRLYI